MIPTSYSAWKNCIEKDCGIQLTQSYIRSRIAELKDNNHTVTIQFIKKYGHEHTRNVIAWFEMALKEYQTT